jgi:uncharacterized protein (TIGR00730 family)
MRERTISVFGTARAREGEPVFALAEQLGRGLAQAGFAVANGGYGGTMLATAKGAREAGGPVIGVTCSAFKNSVANEFVSEQVTTASLDERLETLVRLGMGYVVLPGGTGTLLELAKVWELKNKRFFDRPRPIVLLGDFWRPLVDLVCRDDPRSAEQVSFAEGPADAINFIRKVLGD